MADRASDDIEVHAPPDTIMGVIIDYESYPEWASNVRDVEIRESDEQGRGKHVWYHVDAKVAEVEYVLDYTYHDEHRLTWSLLEAEQLRELSGEYRLEPLDDAVRVHYWLEVDLVIPVPGFMKKRATKMILETSLNELKRRAEELAS